MTEELNPAVRKAITRLEAALDAGSAYEGLQVAKTVSARLRSRGGKEDAADLLGRASEALLRRKEVRENEGERWVCFDGFDGFFVSFDVLDLFLPFETNKQNKHRSPAAASSPQTSSKTTPPTESSYLET